MKKNINKGKNKTTKKKSGGDLKTPRGMHDILFEDYFAYQGFFEKAEEIALYYGFQPIETPILEKEEIFQKTVGEYTDIIKKEMYTLKTKGGERLAMRPEGTVPAMRAYTEHGMHTRPQPVMLYYKGSYFRHERPQYGRFRQFRQFGVEIIGSNKSITDALVIRIFITILEEVGLKNLCVHVNSLGDKECRADYRKALISYFKKHSGKLNTESKDLLKNNPLRLLDSKDEQVIKLKEEAPCSMEFLSGESKEHFKEFLEYLESMKIEYKIDNTLVRGLDYYSRTVFEIKQNVNEKNLTEDGSPIDLGGGGRYNYLGNMLGMKKNISAVGGALGVDRIIMNENVKKLVPRILKKPKVFFIQLGFDAKLNSLPIIDSLRIAKIPIRQSLSKDKLSVQLGTVEKLQIPWVIILGEKEVIDKTAIVRNMTNRSQQTIKQDELVNYLKNNIAR